MYVAYRTAVALVLIHFLAVKSSEVKISSELPNGVYMGLTNLSSPAGKEESRSSKPYLVDLNKAFKNQKRNGSFCGLPPPECEFPVQFGPERLYGCSEMVPGSCQCLAMEDRNSENFRVLDCKAPDEICDEGGHLTFDYKKLDKQHVAAATTSKSNILRREVTFQDKVDIVGIHNEYRAKLARGMEKRLPKGSNIRELRWNEELAFIAQKLADRCDLFRRQLQFNRNNQNLVSRRGLCSRFYKPNFNFFFVFKTFKSQKDDWMNTFMIWHSEANHLRYGVFNGKENDNVKSYTQMIWATTYEIGCGVALHHMGMFNTYYVCYYGPGGNVIGELPYKKGEPATECGKYGKSHNYPELCG